MLSVPIRIIVDDMITPFPYRVNKSVGSYPEDVKSYVDDL